jgi:hypothetical protein
LLAPKLSWECEQSSFFKSFVNRRVRTESYRIKNSDSVENGMKSETITLSGY